METERVIPVVIFLNSGTRPETLELGGDGHKYLEFRYLACDLKRLAADDYRNSSNIIARLNLPNIHYPIQQRLQIYAAAQLGLIQFEPNPNKQRKYIDFIDYYADLSEQEIIEFRTHYLNEEGEIMGLAQILKQEGIQQGIEQGIQEGIVEGRQEGRQEECLALVTRLLRRKFGIQPGLDQLLKQLQLLPVDKQEDLIEALLDWTDLNDLSEWLNKTAR